MKLPNPKVKKATLWRIEPPQPIHTFFTLFGFDPGTTNIGMSFTQRDGNITLYEINLERDKDAATRIMDMYFLLSDLGLEVNRSITVIEGASFGKAFRQNELAEIRATIVLWMRQHGSAKVKIVPPNTIRKTVFNSGVLSAHEYWNDSEIDRDALAALSCLYYADQMED